MTCVSDFACPSPREARDASQEAYLMLIANAQQAIQSGSKKKSCVPVPSCLRVEACPVSSICAVRRSRDA